MSDFINNFPPSIRESIEYPSRRPINELIDSLLTEGIEREGIELLEKK